MRQLALPLSIVILAAAIAWTGMPHASAEGPAGPPFVCNKEVSVFPDVITTDKRLADVVAFANEQIAAGRTHVALFGGHPCAW